MAHLLKLLDKMYKYEMDPTRTVDATERTRDAGWMDGQTDGRADTDGWTWTDGQSDGRMEWNQYTPQQPSCAVGIKISSHQYMNSLYLERQSLYWNGAQEGRDTWMILKSTHTPNPILIYIDVTMIFHMYCPHDERKKS